MIRRLFYGFVWLLLPLALCAEPVKVILDTDIGNDCEDAAALGVLHALADRGEAEILAVIYPMRDRWGAPAIDAINAYYGRPEIPIGTYRGTFEYTRPHAYVNNTALAEGFPHRLKDGDKAYDAIALYRRTLALQPDHSVVIVVIGPEETLSELLASVGDEFSPLSGRDLVAQKVARLAAMGGAFPNSAEPEWNLMLAPAAAAEVARRWPTPIMYSGFEIGNAIVVGQRLFTETPESNPVRKAYALDPKCSHGRMGWDETAVLYGVRGLRDYWFAEANGDVQVDPVTGANQWRPSPDHQRAYLKARRSPEEMKKLIGDLEVQPPRHAPSEPAH
jgi:hypothetical protein